MIDCARSLLLQERRSGPCARVSFPPYLMLYSGYPLGCASIHYKGGLELIGVQYLRPLSSVQQ